MSQVATQPKKEKKSLKWQRDKDREMVKGRFKFHEIPGGTLSFSFRKYKEDPIEKFTMVDGEIYTVPLGIAKHLNNNCWYPVHSHSLDVDGKSSVLVGKKVHRFSFESLEFMDVDDGFPHQGVIEEPIIMNQ